MPHSVTERGLGFRDRGMNSSPIEISITRTQMNPKMTGNVRSSNKTSLTEMVKGQKRNKPQK